MWSLVLALLAGYQVGLPARFELAAGTAGAVSMTVSPEPGFSVSRAGPFRISLAATPDRGGLSLPRRRYRREDAADPLAASPRFDLAVRAAAPGRYRLDVTARFWICRKRSCRPVTDRRAIEVEVTAPARAPAPGADAGAAPPVTRTR